MGKESFIRSVGRIHIGHYGFTGEIGKPVRVPPAVNIVEIIPCEEILRKDKAGFRRPDQCDRTGNVIPVCSHKCLVARQGRIAEHLCDIWHGATGWNLFLPAGREENGHSYQQYG